MTSDIQFETPENVRVSYRAAGLGTRFIAWFVDNILLWAIAIVMLIAALVLGVSADIVSQDLIKDQNHAPMRVVFYFLAVFWAVFSLSSLLYFGLCELLMRGQTLGKRWMGIRVVKTDGFSLDPPSIFVRSLFRVVDHLPPLWIVPLATEKGQRLGDLVAGTVVVADEPPRIGGLREELTSRQLADGRFHFDAIVLKRARSQDVHAIEKILERCPTLSPNERGLLLARVVKPLAARLQVECPDEDDWLKFLEDFLAAEFRRQYRKLG